MYDMFTAAFFITKTRDDLNIYEHVNIIKCLYIRIYAVINKGEISMC